MTPDQMRDASLLELFKLEAEAQAQVLNSGLLVLERDPRHAGSLESCMRAAHSLKGAARIVGLDAGVKVAHVMEDCLVEAQEGRLLLSPEHIDALLQGADILLGLGTPPAQPGAVDPGIDALVARLGALARGLLVPPAAPARAPVVETVTAEPPQPPIKVLSLIHI